MPARGYECYLRLLYKRKGKRRDLLCNHNDGDLFTCEDNMSVSCVKI